MAHSEAVLRIAKRLKLRFGVCWSLIEGISDDEVEINDPEFNARVTLEEFSDQGACLL
jgi:hypothetical protein